MIKKWSIQSSTKKKSTSLVFWFWSSFLMNSSITHHKYSLTKQCSTQTGRQNSKQREHWGQDLNWDLLHNIIPHSWVWNFLLPFEKQLLRLRNTSSSWPELLYNSRVLQVYLNSGNLLGWLINSLLQWKKVQRRWALCSWSSVKNTGSDHSCCKESWTYLNMGRGRGWPLFFINGCISWVDQLVV